MKVGFDLDGTAWKYRDLFVPVARGLKQQGIQIGIVTAHRGLQKADINLWINRGFPEPDFYYSKDDNQLNLELRDWKEYMCRTNNIDYLFDDIESEEVKLICTK